VVIGSGALGSLFAAFLEPFVDITMLSHWPEQIAAIRSHGLFCLHGDGSFTRHDFPVTNNARALEMVRLALVLVKSYQTAQAAYELAPVMAPDGVAITLQNGLGNFETLEAVLGYGRVAQGVTAQGATMLGPGKVRHAGHGLTYVAYVPGKEAPIAGLIHLLNQAGLAAESAPDVRRLQWGKLAVNAGINPLTAILRERNGYLVENNTARTLMSAAALEAERVARAMGIPLPYENAAIQAAQVAEATADNSSSMLQDVLRGAPTEIDAINGAVASHGRQQGIPTPVNELLWRRVKALGPETIGSAIELDRILIDLLEEADLKNNESN
jgi:2-dehydropantoate 2-reductase